MRRSWLLPSFFLAACPNPNTPPTPEPLPVTLSFSVPRNGAIPENFELPYPNELWRRPDGTLDLASYPGASRLLGADLVAEADGTFGPNIGIFLHFEGELNEASLPAAALTIEDNSPLFVAEVLANGNLGPKIPVLFKVSVDGANVLPKRTIAVQPVFGLGFRPGARYVAVMTTGILGADQSPAKPDADFLAIRQEGISTDPELAAADALYEPVFTSLAAAGVARESVAWATVFDIGDLISPSLRVGDFVFAGGQGVPSTTIRQAPVQILSKNGLLIFKGQYDTPRFQNGVPPFLQAPDGQIEFDANGDPIVQAIDPVDVVISIPDQTPPPGGWPVVISNHGTGGDAASFVENANADGEAALLGAQGFAVVGIDQPLHGARFVPGSDVNTATFNPFNLAGTRENVRQALADNVQIIRILQAGLTVDRNGQPVGFDTTKFYFMGHSQGSLSGPALLAWADKFNLFRAAVLSGPSGSVALAVTDRVIPLPNGTETPARELFATVVGEEVGALDEFHPLLSLAQQIIEPNDPLNYGPLLVKEAQNPIDILLTQGFQDVDTPPRTIDAIASAIGIAPAKRIDDRSRFIFGLDIQGFDPLTPPFSANVDGVTAALSQFPDNDHFAIFFNPDAQALYAHFLGTALSAGRAEVQVYGAQ
jgi:pimeloyl-ACP methyl ester carboxylesterase